MLSFATRIRHGQIPREDPKRQRTTVFEVSAPGLRTHTQNCEAYTRCGIARAWAVSRPQNPDSCKRPGDVVND
jgi:hypothetical protein